MSTSLNMREMQIKTSYTSHRSKSIGRNSTINAGESVEQREPPTPMLGMEIGSSHCGGHQAGSLVMKMRMKLEYSLTPHTERNSK